jgi:aspartate-semialdehyde dehydrogenase
MKKRRVGILGATGLVGQRFVSLLDYHPFFEVVSLSASEKSVKKTYGEVVDWYMETTLPEEVANIELSNTSGKDLSQEDLDIVFSALPGKIAFDVEQYLAKEGICVFSNANAHRMEKDVPILIPEINPDHIKLVNKQNFGAGCIITNSNCSTSGLVFGLKPLQQFGIKSVYVTTYQSISGAGKSGVASLDILGNIVPYIAGEEEKIEIETKKILGKFNGEQIQNAEFEVNASCARVPSINGHLESVAVNLEEDISIEEINQAFKSLEGLDNNTYPTAPDEPIILSAEENRPQPSRDLVTERNSGMAVTIGRVRRKGNCVNFFLLVHNTLRGAAGASILNAEYALKKKYLK